jgi:hypothetical protein
MLASLGAVGRVDMHKDPSDILWEVILDRSMWEVTSHFEIM